ncbi:MAG: DUF87 domain-containing protein [Gemmataceae bacterium]
MSDSPPAGFPFDPAEIARPACFYLGQEYDVQERTVRPAPPVMFEARNLVTHGVVVGMTGSGKTGLSIGILEEAAIDGIPAVIIDPKGDLTNLLLQFDGLDPKQFASWINPEDARARNLSVDAYARQIAERWRKGLAESGQPVERVREPQRDTDFVIFTPGSEAGLPLSILRTFAAPKTKLPLEDMTQKINATATALLGLSGISADPLQSREHVLIAQLLQHAWTHGRDLDLEGLIKEVQKPSINRVGAYNLETFFPAKERLKFASQLNNVLASPVFATWTQGEPLDLGSMLYRNGRPQHLIFYLAHLDDNQRMFFTTLLLEEMLGWTRRQPGTTSLRALLYFDEVFGYLPPHPANPPSKQPLLTLLKQARAFGVGVLLATQNPVDLDYKALSNAGTWFVGKLQTERDKARLLDGLESVAAEHGTLADRNYLEKVIASLGNRVFLLHHINQPKPLLFQTRWALSYLRGPMTREEITRVSAPLKRARAEGAAVARKVCNHCHEVVPAGNEGRCPSCGKNPWESTAAAAPVATVAQQAAPVPAVAAPAVPPPVRSTQPVLPPDVTQFYLPVSGGTSRPGFELEYQPWVLGFAEVAFLIDRRAGTEHRTTVQLLARAPEPGHPIEWEKAYAVNLTPLAKPVAVTRWGAVPESVDTGRKLKAMEKAFAEHLYSTQKLSLYENSDLELVSAPGESLDAFRARCRKAAADQRAQALEMERIRYTPRREAADSSTGKGREDRIARLQAEYQAKQDEITERYRRLGEAADEFQVKPRKTDVRVTHFGLAWAPFWRPV